MAGNVPFGVLLSDLEQIECRPMTVLTERRRSLSFAALALSALAAAGCSGPGQPAGHAGSAGQSPPAPVTEHLAGGRFTVTLGGEALQAARTADMNLPGLVARALGHISTLLPGPKAVITVSYGHPAQLIPQTGTAGFTSPLTGRIKVAFGPTPHIRLENVLKLWLPRTFSHEVDHSVRILAGPGFGPTLLPAIVSEGISSVFDEAAFPGAPNPWDRAISQSQECALWKKAEPQLGDTGLYNLWMFGGYRVPHWTGFTIGYDIVKDYLRRHPDTSWRALTSASATTILAGSGYQPCPP